MSFVAVKAAKNRAPLKCKSGQRFSFKRFQSAAFHLSHNSVATLVPITKSDDFGNFTNRGTVIQSSWGMCPLTREYKYKYNKFFLSEYKKSDSPFPPWSFPNELLCPPGRGSSQIWRLQMSKSSSQIPLHCTGKTTFFLSPNILPTDLRKTFLCVSRSRVNV